jgi:hypothetical protein
LVHPDADEVCGDDIDNDCDGGIDDAGAVDAETYYPDADGDGYGDRDIGIVSCVDPGVFIVDTVTLGGDCDDQNDAVSPGSFEVCDFVDNNCDDETDESTSLDASLWFADSDADGSGNYFASAYGCDTPTGHVDNSDDCDDTLGSVVGGATEECDAIDNNCDSIHYLGGHADALVKSRFDAMGEVEDDRLGESLGFLGDQDSDGDDEMLFGAPGHDNVALGLAATGALYMNRGAPEGLDSTDFASLRVDASGRWDVKIEGTRPGAFFGSSVTSGDVNGDGVDDIIAGSYGARVPGFEMGAAYVFYGPVADGEYDAEDADFIFKGSGVSDQAGISVASGDLNGDGIDDIAMGAPGQDLSASDAGGVFVMFGDAGLAGDVNTGSADAYLTGTDAGSLYGLTTEVMDINGDGQDDLIVGAPRDFALDEGSVSVVLGPLSGGAAVADATYTGLSGGDSIGWSLSEAGDVNGDGFPDLLVGSNNNAAYLILGGASLAVSSDINVAASYIFSGLTSQRLAESVAGIGDMDGDGYSDFALSAHRDDDGGNNAGAAIVVYGAADYDAYADANGVIEANDVEGKGRVESGTTFPTYSASNLGYYEGGKLLGGNDGDQFGRPIVGGGDFNGDGVPDFAAASTRYDGAAGVDDVGRVYVFPAGGYGIDVGVDASALPSWYADADCDGFLDENGATYDSCEFHVLTLIDMDSPGDSYMCAADTAAAVTLDDCDDTNSAVYPGAPESANDGVDADCDGFDNENNLPSAYVNITPNSPTTSDSLTATTITSDADDDTLTVTYEWDVDGSVVVGATTNVLDTSYTSRGSRVTVTITVDDGRGVLVTDSDSVTIDNAVPSVTSCDVTPATGGIDAEWTAVAPGLSDDDIDDTPVLGVQWEMRFGPVWIDITGETTDTLASCMDRNFSGSQFNCRVGNSLRAVCTPSDGSDFGDGIESNVVVIENSRPVMTACTIINGTSAATTDTLIGIAFVIDADGDTVTIIYEWLVNSVPSGLTGTVMPSTATQQFDVIQLRCTPTDENAGAGTVATSLPLTISNSLPTAPSVDLTPNSPTSKDELVVTVTAESTDIDGDTITYSYGWTKDSSPFSNPTFPSTNPLVGAGSTARGETWEVTVTPNDGYSNGPSDDDSVTIGNSLPSVDSVVLNPSSDLKTADDVMAAGVGWDDEDGDPEDYIVQWYVNDVAMRGQVNPMILDSANFVRGDEVYVALTAKDAYGTGNSVTSDPLTVINTAPTAPVVDVDGVGRVTPSEDVDLGCFVDTESEDDDGDSVTYRYAWYVNDVLNAETTDSLSASQTAFADVVYCTVMPNDGRDNGDLATSLTVTIQDVNAPPAPVLNAAPRYTNTSSWDFTGQCIEGATDCQTVTLTGTDGASYSTACSADVFTFAGVPFTSGTDVTFTATCADSSSNASAVSNASTTELCATIDPYEDSGDYGDVNTNVVDEWSTLADDGSSFSITANIVEGDAADWYVVRASDDSAADVTNRTDDYHVQIGLSSGASDYAFVVYRGAVSAAQECSTMSSYDDYSWDVETNACRGDDTQSPSGANYCQDHDSDYYIHVKREFNQDCQAYQLTVSNGL